jgi:hypothetical protein
MVFINNSTHFDSLILMGIKNIRQKRTPLKTRSFLSLVVHLKKFGPKLGKLTKKSQTL